MHVTEHLMSKVLFHLTSRVLVIQKKPPLEKDYGIYFKNLKENITGKEENMLVSRSVAGEKLKDVFSRCT